MSDASRVTSVSGRSFHLLILVVGTLFLLVDAFHGNVWFDESYSIAIANHSFVDIWSIGSGDVHPVLFYWALHVLNLIFGQNVLIYRLFAVAGAVALATLGFTHVRRDFGWRVGVLFSFMALFMPYISTMAVEIRMYSWATFAVMLCAVYACRIFLVLRGRPSETVAGLAEGLPRWAGVPRRWWLVFFLASLASAYLHYFGVLSAFMVNLLLLLFLVCRVIRRRRAVPRENAEGGGRALVVFLLGALAQVCLYAPWLTVLVGQVGVVSQTYWASIVFPTTYIELATYPFMTSQLSFAARGAYGGEWQLAFNVVLIILSVLVAALIVWTVYRAVRRTGRWRVADDVIPAIAALAVYAGVYGIAWLVSNGMDSNILYYRYLFVAIGPLLFACAVALSHVRSRVLVGGACAAVLAASLMSQCLQVKDDYDPDNGVPLEAFGEQVEALAASQGGAGPLVVSSDIGFEGVTSVEFRGVSQAYMDWQQGNWDQAYEAYAPTLTSEKSWESLLDDYHGRFIVLGQTGDGQEPRDVLDLSRKPGVTLLDTQSFYRPYERTWFTIAVMEKG